jgi:hypothetical protein
MICKITDRTDLLTAVSRTYEAADYSDKPLQRQGFYSRGSAATQAWLEAA